MKQFAKAITGSSKAPDPVKIVPQKEEPATPLPDPEEQKRAAIRAEMARRKTGRASTLLSDDEKSDTL